MRRQLDWRVPVEPEFFLVVWPRLDVARLMCLSIYPPDLTALVFGINVIRIRRVGKHPETVAGVHVFPLRVGDAAGILRFAHPRTVVLQTAVNAVRIVIVHAYVIKLRHWQVISFPPFAAAVVGVPHSAVVAHEYGLRVGWIDPHIMRITVRALKTAHHRKALPSILADNQ